MRGASGHVRTVFMGDGGVARPRLQPECEIYVLQRDGAEAATCDAEMMPHMQAANTQGVSQPSSHTVQLCLCELS